ncbi:MAG: Cysteine synthase, partial [uncultured Solirubrobacteraceae bacterium]
GPPAAPEPPLRRSLRGHRAGDRQHAARRAQAPESETGRAHLGEDGVGQPDGIGQGPRRAVDDRERRGEGPDPPRPHDPRADLRQHRHQPGDDLPSQGLSAEGRHALQRDSRAHPAAGDVRRADRLQPRRPGIQRRRRDGQRDRAGHRHVLHALPVRQRGQPARALQRHGERDPRGARRDHGVRRRPRHRRHADGQRPALQGGVRRRREDRRRRAHAGRARAGAALARRRLHPADHRPQRARSQDLRHELRRDHLDAQAARGGGHLRRRLLGRDRPRRRADRQRDRRGQCRLHRLRRRLEVPLLRHLQQAAGGDREPGIHRLVV